MARSSWPQGRRTAPSNSIVPASPYHHIRPVSEGSRLTLGTPSMPPPAFEDRYILEPFLPENPAVAFE